MFTPDIAPVTYEDPWLQPLSMRLAMMNARSVRVAYFYEEPNNSTFRYRAYNMAQVLNQTDLASVSAGYFFLKDHRYFDEIANDADVLVICRSRYCHRINTLIAKFKSRRKRVLFDVDDLVFDTSYAHLVVATLGLDVEQAGMWDDWFAMISRMSQTLQLCDGAITTNHFLADKLAAYSRLPVSVVPNFMNREQLDLSERLYSWKERAQFEGDGRICLGYFSGSPSHRLDYAIVEPSLAEILEARPEVSVMVVGYIDHGERMRKFAGRVSREPFQDYINLQRLLARVDFNLMPLQSNAFTDCKSELKYFEAASVGTLSIASPSYTYRRAIEDGKNGYLAKAHQWTAKILSAIDDRAGYQAMAATARDDALAKFGGPNQASTILKALQL